MTTPINLNRVRKAKAKADAAKRAEENRVRHGRTKAETARDRSDREALETKLDAHKRDP